jgi:FkbM family methyltransferase
VRRPADPVTRIGRPTCPPNVPARAVRAAHLAGRYLLTGAVRRLPPGVAAPLRGPGDAGRVLNPVLRTVREVLRRGGIPRAAETFRLADRPDLRFVNADSLVLQQLYWFGEQGWEPELLPWWRHFCRRASRIVELGTNVGYFAVQGAKAAPHARYIAVEPHPVSARVCRQNLALNGITSVEVLTVAAAADPALTTTQLVVPWEQLRTPTVAFMPVESELPEGMASRAATIIDVPAIDVRSLLGDVDLLKLDVEGQEHTLLSAGWPELQAHRPTIFVEVLPGTPRLRALLIRLCTELGYRCYAPARDRLIPLSVSEISTISPQREHGTNDLVLCAERHPPTIGRATAGESP